MTVKKKRVRYASIAMAAINRHVVLRGSSVMTVLILARYCMSPSIYLVPQLQLWHLLWLESAQSVGGLTSEVMWVLRTLSHGDAAPLNTHWLPNKVDHILCNIFELLLLTTGHKTSRLCAKFLSLCVLR
jgi:hypothetical protein